MKAKQLAVFILLVSLLVISVTATAAMLLPVPDNAKNSNPGNSPVIENTGESLALTPPGLEKKVFVHYAKSPCNNNGVCEPELGEKKSCADCRGNGEEEPKTTCYGFLAKDVKWKQLPVNYVIDPDNPFGLNKNFVVNAISAAAGEWNFYTGTQLFGSYTVDSDSSWDISAPDGRNELLFGDYPQQGVIGVTVTWGYFSGPPWSREILEFDVLFDTDFAWGDATIDSNLMDLQNIATHEIGHGIGLDDLYKAGCSEETMYGYSSEGEIKKRTLEAGDIKGLQKLYGS